MIFFLYLDENLHELDKSLNDINLVPTIFSYSKCFFLSFVKKYLIQNIYLVSVNSYMDLFLQWELLAFFWYEYKFNFLKKNL